MKHCVSYTGYIWFRYQTETTGGAPLERWFYSAETGEKSE
jgi:hypothetical protein